MKESSNQSRYDKGLALVADSNDIIFRFNSSRTCYQPFVIIYINNSCEQCDCPHPCKHCCRGPIGPTGPTGPMGATGPTGPTGPSATGVAHYTLNQTNFATGGTSIQGGAPITGWQDIFNGSILPTWISCDSNTGIFTLNEPGVYQISSAVQLFPTNAFNPGYQIDNDIYTYALAISFTNLDGAPNPLAAPYTGFSRLETSILTPILTITYNFYTAQRVRFSIINTSNTPIRVLNSQQSGSAGHVSVLKLSNNVLS